MSRSFSFRPIIRPPDSTHIGLSFACLLMERLQIGENEDRFEVDQAPLIEAWLEGLMAVATSEIGDDARRFLVALRLHGLVEVQVER